MDTADCYGPETSEVLIAEALYPYPDDVVFSTKGGRLALGDNREHLRRIAIFEARAAKMLVELPVIFGARWEDRRLDRLLEAVRPIFFCRLEVVESTDEEQVRDLLFITSSGFAIPADQNASQIRSTRPSALL